MNGRLAIPAGSLFGVRLRVHVAFLLLLGLLLAQTLILIGGEGVAWFGSRVALLFGSFLLHELGHAMAARAFSVHVYDIVLGPFGGMARLQRLPDDPRVEGTIAAAGPLSNGVLFLLLYPLFALDSATPWPAGPVLGWTALEFALVVNAAMAVLNLIPAFPMDGGRILRAALAPRMGRERATRLCVFLGRGLACASIAAGFADRRWVAFVLLGAFIWHAGSAELENARNRNQGDGPSPAADRFLGAERDSGARDPREPES